MTDKKAISHHASATEANEADKAECDRLGALAKAEDVKRSELLTRSQMAHRAGDRDAARVLSKQGKVHGARRDSYSAQARDLIFRANNRCLPLDTIDLHGLYVKEAKEFLTARIDATAAEVRHDSERPLCVIVGRGNHSTNGERKLAPAVEHICRARGLQFCEDETNPGRILISLRPGGVGRGQRRLLPTRRQQAPPLQALSPLAPLLQAPLPQAPPPQAYAESQLQYGRYQSQYGNSTDRSGSRGAGLCFWLICLMVCFGFLCLGVVLIPLFFGLLVYFGFVGMCVLSLFIIPLYAARRAMAASSSLFKQLP